MPHDPSKTETATTKRRNKAREDGNVPKSQELPKALIVLAGLVALWFWIGFLGKDMLSIFHWFLSHSVSFNLNPESAYELFQMVASHIARMVLPIMFIVGLAAYLVMRLQVGSLWTTKVFNPKFGKFINILPGLQRMLADPKTLIRLGKSVLMALFIAIAPYIVIKNEMANLLPLFYQNAHGLAIYILSTGAKMVIYALVPMMIIAIADLVYTRWDYEENLKMSKDEVKDERKQAEGDPMVKNAQKAKMLKVMMRRMMQDVPKADVVITNPTHIAVAIRYNPMDAPAPVVLAMGVDHIAQKIKEIARENDVPIKENKPLAQALYKSCEVGEEIPPDLYKAVAALLATLFKFRSQKAQA